MKVVVDTNVFVSGLLNPSGNPGLIVALVLSNEVDLLIDDRILHEYAEILCLDRLDLPAGEVRTLLDYVERESIHVSAVPLSVTSPDPDDQSFFEVAIAGGADFLITGNMRHFPNVSQAISPRDFIALWRETHE